MMKNLLVGAILLFVSPAWAGCPLISVTPCKTAVHHVHKAKPNLALARHEIRIAGLERRLALAEAVLAAQHHQISVMRQQCLQNK
jgi:hypothetical protein